MKDFKRLEERINKDKEITIGDITALGYSRYDINLFIEAGKTIVVKPDIININNIKELDNVEALTEEQLASWWTLVVTCPDIPMKDRLAASDKLAKYRGMFERGKTIATSGGAVYKWKSTVEAEIVHDTETNSGND